MDKNTDAMVYEGFHESDDQRPLLPQINSDQSENMRLAFLRSLREGRVKGRMITHACGGWGIQFAGYGE